MRKLVYVMFLGLNFLFLQQIGVCQGQYPMPKGDWQLSTKPSLIDNSPIIVTSVTTDAKRGLAVTKVILAFGAGAKQKPIAKFRLGWVVIDESKNARIIGAGESGFIFLNLSQGRSIRLNSTIFAFSNFAESIGVKNLNGKFRVDILVSSVEFANGETWKFDLPKGNSTDSQYIRVSKKVKKAKACPDQSCDWYAPGGTYRCITSVGFSCTNAANGQSCNETRCGKGDGDIELEM